ncbi:MAG: hypothetical protein P4L35_03405 [Ignavibacteriaceae bacterium]|nr:hypothetical protein [Ignavibacteriaceae bacterium]
MKLLKIFLSLLTLIFLPSNIIPQQNIKISSSTFGSIEARQIGPAAMSGRITAIDAVNKESRIIYVGSAGGGIWKSINGGASFRPIFDKYNQSIGCLTIDQNHPDTIWAGSGECNMRNSVSVGDGIYKSLDGGDNWKKAGLELSEHISRIIIDPLNSDIVYAAVPGNLWNDSPERGLYKTTDGGKSWIKILYVNDKTGCADIQVDPKEPGRIYASMWQFRRTPWSFSSGGEGSGLFKSEDYGKTWKHIDKQFSPDGLLGRICLAVAPTEPKNIYAMVESNKTALYSSTDYGENWKKESSTENATARPFYFSVLMVDPTDAKRIYRPTFNLSISVDGGKSFTEPTFESGWVHSDHHAIWIDPINPSHLLLGTDGGVYISLDKGYNWRFLNNLPVSQFYHVSFDNENPYNVIGGLQDNGSWFGPSRSPNGIKNADWKTIGWGDGFWAWRDRLDKDIFYSESQGGSIQRYNIKTNEGKEIKPYELSGEAKLRFNWNTPIQMSPTDPKVIYIGAQYLFKTTDRGNTWERISTDLTTNDPEKQKQEESGGLSIDNSAAENHCTIFSICESPKDKELIWVGTDDGNLQVTKDGGRSWSNVVKNVPGLPVHTWVSSVEASSFDENCAYVTFDGHAFGDMKTYLYKTTDLGKSWQSLSTPDIKGYAHKIKEDIVNNKLLFLGTEFGLFASIDGGENWAQFTGKVPNVTIRDIAIQPNTSDLLLATHGRGIFIIDDITPIRNLNKEILNSEAVLLPSRTNYIDGPTYGSAFGTAGEFIGQNPIEEAVITYYLKERTLIGDVNIEIYNKEGKLLSRIPGTKRKGINRITWPMRMKPPRVATAVRITYGGFTGPLYPEGTYTVKLIKGDKVFTQKMDIDIDPSCIHSKEDRDLQYNTSIKLYNMQEDLAYLSEVINRINKTAIVYSDTVKNSDLRYQLKEFSSKLTELSKTIIASKEGTGITGEEKLREKLSQLYSSIIIFPGRPTDSQLQRVKGLEDDFNKANISKDNIFKSYLDKINSQLPQSGMKKLELYSKEQFAIDRDKEKGI